tara:strand:+ start:16 stop:468 length:453 start_codon:yes stop_codon:yes gene_type:complete
MIIGIDFDGTCVTHEFPEVGKDIGAVPVLKRLVSNGHQLILFTMRSDHFELGGRVYEKETDLGYLKYAAKKCTYLTDAIEWFDSNQIPLYGIQINPNQTNWTASPKAYCHMYIDDAALGCPLMYDSKLSDKAFVNWAEVEKILENRKVII